LMYKQDLNMFYELASIYFIHTMSFSTKLFAITEDSRFTETRKTAIELFKIFVKLVPYVGATTSLVLRSCLFNADIDSFDSSHKFIEISKQPAKEAYWPLAWLGLSVEVVQEMPQEQRDAILLAIPNPDAKLWVERAFAKAAKNRKPRAENQE
jgi:hypothetical protein